MNYTLQVFKRSAWSDVLPDPGEIVSHYRYYDVRQAWGRRVGRASRAKMSLRIRIKHDSGRIYDEWEHKRVFGGWSGGYVPAVNLMRYR